jgi:aspartate aminotransferase-like enzyme
MITFRILERLAKKVHNKCHVVTIYDYILCRLRSVCLTKDNNKVAIVTGSSKGIGKAIATEFAKAGYSVVINSRG